MLILGMGRTMRSHKKNVHLAIKQNQFFGCDTIGKKKHSGVHSSLSHQKGTARKNMSGNIPQIQRRYGVRARTQEQRELSRQRAQFNAEILAAAQQYRQTHGGQVPGGGRGRGGRGRGRGRGGRGRGGRGRGRGRGQQQTTPPIIVPPVQQQVRLPTPPINIPAIQQQAPVHVPIQDDQWDSDVEQAEEYEEGQAPVYDDDEEDIELIPFQAPVEEEEGPLLNRELQELLDSIHEEKTRYELKRAEEGRRHRRGRRRDETGGLRNHLNRMYAAVGDYDIENTDAVRSGQGGLTNNSYVNKYGEEISNRITRALGDFEKHTDSYNKLVTLLTNKHSTAIQTVTFEPGSSPAAISLAVLHMQSQLGVKESNNFRYIIDISGTSGRSNFHAARTISPNDPQFIANLTAGLLTGRIEGMNLGDAGDVESLTESDKEVANIWRDAENMSVRVMRVSKNIAAPDVDDYSHEIGVGNAAGNAMSAARAGMTTLGPQEQHPFFAGGPNTGGAGFFGFWLDERWPEDLSHIQVFKKSQAVQNIPVKDDRRKRAHDKTKQFVKYESMKYELGCLANSFLVQGMETGKLVRIMGLVSGTANPNFPTSCLRKLSERLCINIVCTFYDVNHRTRGRKVKTYMGDGGEEGGPVYRLGRIENHFVPDIDSGWTKKAAGDFDQFYQHLGDAWYDISLDRLKKARTIVVNTRNGTPRLMIRSDSKTLTYGELLCILIYGKTGNHSIQRTLATKMNPIDYCMKSELYSRFKNQFARRDLPYDLNHEEMISWIQQSSRPMKKEKQNMLNDDQGRESRKIHENLGKEYSLGREFGKRKGHGITDKQREKLGYTIKPEWVFCDKYVMEAGGLYGGGGNTMKFDVPQWFALMSMDSETYCDENNVHKPYMFSVSFFYDTKEEKIANFRRIDIVSHDHGRQTEEGRGNGGGLSCFEEMTRSRYPHVIVKTRNFLGKNCAQMMCDFFASNELSNYHLHVISHNAHYDINMLVGNSDAVIVSGVIKSASRLNTVIVESGGKISNHQCSYAVTGIPLKDFATTFDLEVQKEFMPYDAYTEKSLFFRDGTMNESACVRIKDVWVMTKAKSYEEFKESVTKANAIAPDYIDDFGVSYQAMNLWKYAMYYCNMDCSVLLQGYINLRSELFKLPIPEIGKEENQWRSCALDIIHAVSLPQYATHYLGRCGVFEGVYQFNGCIREYISRGVVGGKCMIMGNAPHRVSNTEIDDFDACSLYPAAMKRISEEGGGFTVGLPKFWKCPGEENETGCRSGVNELPMELEGAHQYFVTVKIWSLGRPLLLPIISGVNDSSEEGVDSDGGRHFTNHLLGKPIVVDRVTLEDIIIHHHGADVEYMQALYWNDGGNTKIGPVIEYLYESRMRLKKMGKGAAQQARKLTMNTAYGRMIMKPIEKKLFFVSGQVKIYHYLARHSSSTATANFIRDDFAVVERRMPVFDHYSTPHLGAHVLSMSRRIMNEVTTLAHDQAIIIHYMDTDSMHVARSKIPQLSKAFFKKYGRKLVVTPGIETDYTAAEEALGRFHSDFQGKGKDFTNPVSVEFIAIGKKTYYDRLMVHDKRILAEDRTRENGTYYDHVRMKGIPTSCVVRKSEDEEIPVKQIYLDLLDGKPADFDLTQGSIRFEMTKNFTTVTKTAFPRTVKLDEGKLNRAEKEWELNGWPNDLFPYHYLNGIDHPEEVDGEEPNDVNMQPQHLTSEDLVIPSTPSPPPIFLPTTISEEDTPVGGEETSVWGGNMTDYNQFGVSKELTTINRNQSNQLFFYSEGHNNPIYVNENGCVNQSTDSDLMNDDEPYDFEAAQEFVANNKASFSFLRDDEEDLFGQEEDDALFGMFGHFSP